LPKTQSLCGDRDDTDFDEIGITPLRAFEQGREISLKTMRFSRTGAIFA
jgi:hypothetical protein